MTDVDSRLSSDLSLAVIRLARQLRFRRPDSPVSLSQLSALATVAKEGPMTPGALAIRERVRPPSMTRVIASLVDLGFVDRTAHPADRRQVLVSVSRAGADLIEAERKASREWLQQRLDALTPEQRQTLLEAADLMLAFVDEGSATLTTSSTSWIRPFRGWTIFAISTVSTAGRICPAARDW